MAKRSVFAYVKTKQSTKVMQKFSEKKRGKRDCVIYNTKTKKAIKCQFNPSDLPRTRSANYASVTAPGMAYPVIQFVNGETEDIDIELFFYKPEKTEEIRTFDNVAISTIDLTPVRELNIFSALSIEDASMSSILS